MRKLMVGLGMFAVLSGCSRDRQKRALPAGVVKLGEEVSDTPLKVQLVEKYRVPSDMTRDGISSLLATLQAEAAERTGFNHASNPTHIQIAVFHDGADWTKDNGSQVAILNKVRSGPAEISFNTWDYDSGSGNSVPKKRQPASK